MEIREYIDSGILELYVYGSLSEAENKEVTEMANNHPEIKAEIRAIEQAIIKLSSSFSPLNSLENYEKIKAKLEFKETPEPTVINIESANSWTKYLGWVAAVILLVGILFQYNQVKQNDYKVTNVEIEKESLKKEFDLYKENIKQLKEEKAAIENNLATVETNLAIIRDLKNTVVTLSGQAPESSAKIYWNKESQTVYLDASSFPEAPEGMVYQVWSLKLKPMTPTSIGLLDNFKDNAERFFALEKTTDAEAFGITLEPAGGSLTPTMEQLYTLGKV